MEKNKIKIIKKVIDYYLNKRIIINERKNS